MKKLEEKKNTLSKELKPLEEYLKAFEDAINGKKPFFKSGLEKQVVGLIAKYKLLEEEKKTTEKKEAAAAKKTTKKTAKKAE